MYGGDGGGTLFQYLQDLGVFQETQFYLQEELLSRLSINGVHDDNGIIIEDSLITHLGCSMGNHVMNLKLSEYDFGEGNLFKAPETVIEETLLLELDPVTASISMMPSVDDIIASEAMKVLDVEAINSSHLQSDLFYECKKDFLDSNPAIEELFSSKLDVQIQEPEMEKKQILKDKTVEGSLQKSVSFSCLESKEWTNGVATGSRIHDLRGTNMEDEMEASLGMRRAYSEGDIENLGSVNVDTISTSILHVPSERFQRMDSQKIEERRQKLSRYLKKKTRRNFGKKSSMHVERL